MIRMARQIRKRRRWRSLKKRWRRRRRRRWRRMKKRRRGIAALEADVSLVP